MLHSYTDSMRTLLHKARNLHRLRPETKMGLSTAVVFVLLVVSVVGYIVYAFIT